MTQIIQKAQLVTQDEFPGCWIEPRWSRIDQIKNAPFYAIRIAMEAKVTESPRGQTDYVSLRFEGKEFVLHRENYEVSRKLATLLTRTYFERYGFLRHPIEGFAHFRFKVEMIFESLKFLNDQAIIMLDIPMEKTKVIWILPDLGPCGYYRSTLPARYMQGAHGDKFHSEGSEFLNYSAVAWFDAAMMHRYPPQQMLSVFQELKASNKVMIYEYDDDLFNVPEWNMNAKHITPAVLERARTAMEMADIIVGSTQTLADISSDPDIAHVGPNLIDMDAIGPPLKCGRALNHTIEGYKPVRRGDRIEYHGRGRRLAEDSVTEENYDPVRILWTGSPTHDKDLEIYTKVVKSLIEEYGMAVRFMFYGYCPTEFLEVHVSSGNSQRTMVVKEKYAHCISSLEPTHFSQYYEVIRKLDPDIAICPLTEHPFNLSKSNLKVLEMGAFGIPVIVSDIGPYQFIKQSFNGLKVPHDRDCPMTEVNQWTYSLKELIKNAQYRQQIGANLLKTVMEEWSWNIDNENRRKWDAIFEGIHKAAQERPNKQRGNFSSEFKEEITL